jgi:hypothetical protein
MKELLKSLVDPSVGGVYVTLWSENSLGVANEIMEKLAQEISGPAAHTPPVRRRRALSCACARAHGAPSFPAPSPPARSSAWSTCFSATARRARRSASST